MSGRQVEVVVQNKSELAAALKWEEEVLRNLDAEAGHRLFMEPRSWYVGYRGELAVARWLKGIRWPFRFRVDTGGRSQRAEIVSRVGGRWLRIEVKATAGAGRRMLMMPAYQKMEFDVLVGVWIPDLDRPEAHLMGWLSRKDVDRRMRVEMVKVMTRQVEFERTREMFRLVPALLELQTVEEWSDAYGEVPA